MTVSKDKFFSLERSWKIFEIILFANISVTEPIEYVNNTDS